MLCAPKDSIDRIHSSDVAKPWRIMHLGDHPIEFVDNAEIPQLMIPGVHSAPSIATIFFTCRGTQISISSRGQYCEGLEYTTSGYQAQAFSFWDFSLFG
jgi:hypothetical protein